MVNLSGQDQKHENIRFVSFALNKLPFSSIEHNQSNLIIIIIIVIIISQTKFQ